MGGAGAEKKYLEPDPRKNNSAPQHWKTHIAELLPQVALQAEVLLALSYQLLLKVLHQVQQDVVLQK